MFSLAELDRICRCLVEDLDVSVKRFRDQALGCYDLVEERMRVNICLHSMLEEYRIFLENLFVSSFSKLMETARLTNGMVHRTL